MKNLNLNDHEFEMVRTCLEPLFVEESNKEKPNPAVVALAQKTINATETEVGPMTRHGYPIISRSLWEPLGSGEWVSVVLVCRSPSEFVVWYERTEDRDTIGWNFQGEYHGHGPGTPAENMKALEGALHDFNDRSQRLAARLR